MSRSRWRVLRWVFGLPLALVAALGAGVAVWGYRSLPAWSGSAELAGLERPVEILRDGYGIPHIFAETAVDAYFGLGYAHAQDRLWQMEIDRRLASGRLAELFGGDAVERDRLFRTLGLRRAAARALEQLEPTTRQLLEGY